MNPQSQNPLIINDFRVSVARLPNVEFWASKANIPGFELNTAPQNNPFGTLPQAGNGVNWQAFSLSYLPDEHLRNHLEIFDWCMAIAFPESFDQFDPADLVSDIVLSVLDSNKRPVLQFTFLNAWPVTVDDIEFDTTMPTIEYRPVNVTFAYDRWTYKRL